MVKFLQKIWNFYDKYQTLSTIGGGFLITIVTVLWGHFSHLPSLMIFTCLFCLLTMFLVLWYHLEKIVQRFLEKSSPYGMFISFKKTKLKQGLKLFNSSMDDKPQKVFLKPDQVKTLDRLLPDGSMGKMVLDSYLDNKTEFRKYYSKWRSQVFMGINFSLGEVVSNKLFGDGNIPSPQNQYGNYRDSLSDDLMKLDVLNPYSTAFKNKFKKEPHILKEFLEFKCP